LRGQVLKGGGKPKAKPAAAPDAAPAK
jgi:hypothetical protein